MSYKTDCFGYIRKGDCRALTEQVCANGECPFYKGGFTFLCELDKARHKPIKPEYKQIIDEITIERYFEKFIK